MGWSLELGPWERLGLNEVMRVGTHDRISVLIRRAPESWLPGLSALLGHRRKEAPGGGSSPQTRPRGSLTSGLLPPNCEKRRCVFSMAAGLTKTGRARGQSAPLWVDTHTHRLLLAQQGTPVSHVRRPVCVSHNEMKAVPLWAPLWSEGRC